MCSPIVLRTEFAFALARLLLVITDQVPCSECMIEFEVFVVVGFLHKLHSFDVAVSRGDPPPPPRAIKICHIRIKGFGFRNLVANRIDIVRQRELPPVEQLEGIHLRAGTQACAVDKEDVVKQRMPMVV